MEERKWENLNSDCLANVFGRLDLETRLLDIPLICKHWYHALLNPLCWQKLVFPLRMYQSRLANRAFKNVKNSGLIKFKNVKNSGLIKFVVDRSKGCATTLVLPHNVTKEDLIYVSDVCPSLKVVALPSTYRINYQDTISELIVKWKRLEVLNVDDCCLTGHIIDNIGLYCKNFVELSVNIECIDQEVASAIVLKLGTIKRLVLDNSCVEKDNLVRILRGCTGLELLYVRNCEGFDENDKEILKIASGIKDFRCEGSTTGNYDYGTCYEYFRDKYDHGDYNNDKDY